MAHAESTLSPFTTHETPQHRAITHGTKLQPSLQSLPSSGADAGKKFNAERSRTHFSPPSTLNVGGSTSSASSSSTSLTRPIPPPGRNGSNENVEMHQRRADPSEAIPVIYGSEQSSHLRTLAESSSGHSHGRQSMKKRPPPPAGPGVPLGWSSPRGPPPPPMLPTRSPNPVQGAAMAVPTHPVSPASPTSSVRPAHLASPPGLNNTFSTPPSQSGSNFPQRRPSLASPLPPTPIVPSSLPKAAVPRATPQPLNLAAASPATQRRQQHYHATSGSLSSPHSSPQSSPPTHGHKLHSKTSSSNVSQSLNAAQGQGWSHAQYITVPRPTTGGSNLPDSPSTMAMMKRLLAKPAPISTTSNFSATSGSESEGLGIVHMKRKDLESTIAGGRGTVSDGGDRVRQRDVSAGRGIEFDMNLDALDQNIATLGQFMGSQSDKYTEKTLPPITPPEGREKEKKLRNVLRRRPSGNVHSAQSSHPSSPQSSPARHTPLPVLAPFSPLTLSPLHTSQEFHGEPGSASKSHTLLHDKSFHQSPHRSVSASAALPGAARKAVPQSNPSPGIHHSISAGSGMVSSSLRPPLPYSKSGASSRSSSRGSSPARSPVVSTLGSSSGTSRPAKAQDTRDSSSTPATPVSTGKEREKTSVTPAASLIEAYKRQEKEREERRQTAELERLKHREGLKVMRADSRSHSLPSSRRHSLDDVDKKRTMGAETGGNGAGGLTRKQGDHLDAVSERKEVHSFASGNTSDSGFSHLMPRVNDDDPSDAPFSGKGFDAIEKIVGTLPPLEKEGSSRLAKTVSSAPPATPKRIEELRSKQPRPTHAEGDEEEVVNPYYTVFGSTSGRVVAVGGPEDSWDAYGQGYWDSSVLGPRPATAVSAAEKEKGKESLRRSLSRKVSWRWKKQGGAVLGAVGDEEHREGRLLGRASMQERRKGGSASRRDEHEDQRMLMKNRRSLRLSIDKFSDVLEKDDEPPLPSLTRASPRAPAGDGADSDGATECGKLVKPKKGESSPSGSGGAGSSSKFWKLMRRISMGGLKEKYQDTSPQSPPPVPHLPKDYHTLHASRSNDSSLKQHHQRNDPKKNSPASSSPTIGVVVSSAAPTPPRQPKSPPTTSPSQPPRQPRPSTTTRSSSPVSSDVASSKFFHRTHSAHSSTSSFGEENPPPVPKAPPGTAIFSQHIIPPSELGKGHEGSDLGAVATPQLPRNITMPTQRVPAMDEDWTIVRSPSVELPSLPLPPRRPQVNANIVATFATEPGPADTERSESPTIPFFSTTDAVNSFPARRLSSTLSAKSKNSPVSPLPLSAASMLPSPSLPTSLPPPPRPLRSAQRPNPASSRIAVPQGLSPPVKQPAIVPDIPHVRRSESYARVHNRRSSGGLSTTSTARPRRRSSSFGATSSSHRSVSPPPPETTFTFRELDSTGPRYALTEQEKAEKWDDLLERSDRAGGTLHIAGGARILASDHLKFSRP
ncbi:hypothetical protein BDZ97DRAFT_1923439 [Flammula alnicola]|nr:hypothetical protein BDZ97DRAFT_1923439 [Flammula alnicola]